MLHKSISRFLLLTLGLALVLTLAGCGGATEFNWDSRDQALLAITGDYLVTDPTDPAQLSAERAYSLDELAALPQSEQVYSTLNTGNFRKQALAQGVSVADLLACSGFDAERTDDAAADITFSSGGYSKTVPALFSTAFFRYPNQMAGDFETKEFTQALIALKYVISGDNTDEVPATDSLESLEQPMLTLGALDPEDMNNSAFIKELDTVCVGQALAPVITLFGLDYTRAQLLLLPRVSYTYDGQSYRGVALADLLSLLDTVDETTGEPIPAEPADGEIFSLNLDEGGQVQLTTAEIRDPAHMFMLAYEIKSDEGWQALPAQALCSKAGVELGVSSLSRGQDYSHSPYKHVSYQGTDLADTYAPDAITGATLTVEGPGVTATTPIMISDLEKTASANIYRGPYTQSEDGATRIYEGVTILSIVDGLVNAGVELSDVGDNIQVDFRNRWRQTVATISYNQLLAAAEAGAPVILAYGVGSTEDESLVAPFVYDNEAGRLEELDNDDGGLRLVYAPDTAEGLPGAFCSVAYIYVEYATPVPGFKHTAAQDEAYNNPENTEYILTLVGSALGREVNLTVAELEAMVEYGPDGLPDGQGLGYQSEYGLSNTTYWYVNTYEGVKLWDLLCRLGLDGETYAEDTQTRVSLTSWDNYRTTASFTMQQLAHPEMFFFYEKSPLDIGTNRPSKEQLATPEYQPDNSDSEHTDANGYPALSGYPVMIAYGVNGYPYVKNADLEGYESGLGNDGGPVRVIFGKADNMNRDNPEDITNYAYFYNNGSNQLQRAMEIYVGEEIRYSTHYQNPDYQAMASQQALTVEIVTEDGSSQTTSYTLAQLEQLIYGVEKVVRDNDGRQEKAYYQYAAGEDALFEGVNLWWLLSESIGLPGALGAVELYGDGQLAATIDLETIKGLGGNALRRTSGLGAVLAYSRNGWPLVRDEAAAGYVAADVAGQEINNSGGPLAFVAPAYEGSDYAYVANLSRVVVHLQADSYAHSNDYAAYGEYQLNFSGDVGVEGALTVAGLETRQKYMVTAAYADRTYRGLDLLQLLNDSAVQASSTMESVTVSNARGESLELTVAEMNAAQPRYILAYGLNANPDDRNQGLPLVPAATDSGYDAAVGNEGGPLLLIGPKGQVSNVASIQVTAAEITGWTHTYSYYADYLDQPVLRITGSGVATPVTFTRGQLESLSNELVLDAYKVVNDIWYQGVDLNKLIANYVELADGQVTSFTGYAKDGYSTVFDGSYLADGINGKPVIIAYGQGNSAADGLPLVDGNDSNDIYDGFDPAYSNAYGPIRMIVNDNTGWCVKWLSCIVIGSGAMEDPLDFPDELADIEVLL